MKRFKDVGTQARQAFFGRSPERVLIKRGSDMNRLAHQVPQPLESKTVVFFPQVQAFVVCFRMVGCIDKRGICVNWLEFHWLAPEIGFDSVPPLCETRGVVPTSSNTPGPGLGSLRIQRLVPFLPLVE